MESHLFIPNRSMLIHLASHMLVHAALLAAGADRSSAQQLGFTIERTVARQGYDGQRCWVHARAGIVPGQGDQLATVVLTAQPLELAGSDVFYALHSMHTADLGRQWTPLEEQVPFQRKVLDPRTQLTVCDFVPQWHAASQKLLGTGQTVWYRDNKVMPVRERATAYATYDPAKAKWSAWKTLAMPAEARFGSCGAGSVQRCDLPGGEILLPMYFKEPAAAQYYVTVCRCRFDGETLTYLEHGDELTVAAERGLFEPSLTKFGDQFYLTMRNDRRGYVARSADGLHYGTPQVWKFDDGSGLGNYNTQQHWVTHSDALYLVYTRRGADNDHVFRHRAPLFIARVDPRSLAVIRNTEQIAVPERGARLGNFGVTYVSPQETWITAAEWMQSGAPERIIPVDNPRGADNTIHIVKLKWHRPNHRIDVE